jgi:SAM-dependent methyltransferase
VACREATQIHDSGSGAVRAAKELTQTVLTPILVEGPIWRHAYEKPRGYPGDFEIMNMMYERQPQGQSVFSRIVHLAGCSERLAATVGSRREFLASELASHVATARECGRSLVRVTNLGSGPAQEVADVLQAGPRAGGVDLIATLIDQDADALEYAYRLLSAAGREWPGRFELRLRHIAFADLLKDAGLLAELGNQDLVYSAGFFDYLSDKTATVLLAQLWSLVASGGRLLVGNAGDDADAAWAPEFVLDWRMIYRTEEQMRGLCEGLEEVAAAYVSADSSESWRFLDLRRR